MSRFFRAAVLGLLILGAGCASSSEMSPSASFVPGQADTGLLIVGAAADRYSTFLGLTQFGSVLRIDLTWTRLEGGMAPVRERDRTLVRFRREGCFGLDMGLSHGDPCDMREMAWHVLQVPPGDYQLSEIGALASMGNGQRYTTTRLLDGVGLITRVAAGEIVYIGDFTLDLVSGPAKMTRYGRDVEAAQRAVAALPRVAPGAVAYRPPVPRARFLSSGGQEQPSSLPPQRL